MPINGLSLFFKNMSLIIYELNVLIIKKNINSKIILLVVHIINYLLLVTEKNVNNSQLQECINNLWLCR